MTPSHAPLTIIMYHYVRPIAGSRYPRIKGLEAQDFEGQLDYLQKHYSIVSMQQVVQAARSNMPLPAVPALLTFDDGYTDHYAHVFPALIRRGLSAAFFPPVRAIREREILDVNKIHFVLQAQPDLTEVIRQIDQEVVALRLGALDSFRAEYRKPSRYDTGETMYVKRMLQFALPEVDRARIVQDLFARFVSSDAASFADELYATEDNLREMIAAGMSIGGHGYSHAWLNKLSPEAQTEELHLSYQWLQKLGACEEHFVFCYPFGGYNQHTKDVLQSLGCAAAVTTKVGLAALEATGMLDLMRLDTNDIPRDGQTPPVEWTTRAKLQPEA
jgi:peptidoglycan/xylan/chitin deacetylase (PgdA/CDA1 family)